jgi:acyl-CoA dehydrogenase
MIRRMAVAAETLLLRDTARAFATREVAPNIDEWERAGEVPRELHRKAAAAGLLGLDFPEEVGGQGGDFTHGMVLTEELIQGGGSSGICAALLTHGIALPHIVAAGNPAQVERYVRPTLAGETIGALAVTEPRGGSDVAGIATTARREGDEYVVNGAKTYITSGVRADFLTTAVRTGGAGHDGVSLLVVEKAMPGVQVSRRLDKMGWLCSDTAELAFTDVRVPVENLVGDEGTGFVQLMRHFESERLGMAVQAYATAQRCVDLSVEWTTARGLVEHQVVRHKLAEMARQTDVAREYARAVARRWVAGEADRADVAMAKNTAVYACDFVVQEAVQLHGGLGFMRGVEVERHYRDARVLGIGGGANEVLNEIVAKRLLGRR